MEKTFLEIFMDDFYRDTFKKHNDALEIYVKQNLSVMGYKFSSQQEFYSFCKRRVSRVAFDDKPHYYELYLDHVNQDNMGKKIGSYSDDYKLNWEVNKEGSLTVKVTIG